MKTRSMLAIADRTGAWAGGSKDCTLRDGTGTFSPACRRSRVKYS
ncbi:hypothetical protein OIB37_32930 [Streptomyces sp. NBC_00820]|nr:hypothetical protein OIB37_32930 [Streptomyces sp. NBC_00820]